MRFTIIAAAMLLPLAACDGPREQAGEKADNASGAVKSEDTMRSGPAETMGEKEDRAAEAANDAKEARADALEEEAVAARANANRKAEELRQQADQVRNGQ